MRIRFPFAESGWRYDILYTTNLLTGLWLPMELDLEGEGAPLTVLIEGNHETSYLRTQTQPMQ